MMNRIVYLDYLKIIGLFFVILAHVSPPTFINQFRSFDVPLLVLVSGYLASKSYKSSSTKAYLWKRFKRLVLPAWIFCFIFLPIRICFLSIPSWEELIKEFTFQRDSDVLGFLWVIWVYLICACIIPYISKIKFSSVSLFYIIIIFLCFELLSKTNLVDNRFLYVSFFTIVPYGCITFLGFNLDKIMRPKIWIIIFLTIYIIMAIAFLIYRGSYVQTAVSKYPAQLYYLSYAIGISLLLFFVLQGRELPTNKLVNFISSSSLWIYLWHILVLYAVKMIIINDKLWLIQYIIIIVFSCIITYIQNLIVDRLIKKYNIKWLNIFKG